MSTLLVYVSFDLEHDQDLHDRLTEQGRVPAIFTVASRSERGQMTDAWAARVRGRISDADEVIVICGEHTDESLQVSAELEIAREEHKPYVLLWGRRENMCKKPKSARSEDGMYLWTPSVLEYQLASCLRALRDADVPDGLKRQRPLRPISSGA